MPFPFWHSVVHLGYVYLLSSREGVGEFVRIYSLTIVVFNENCFSIIIFFVYQARIYRFLERTKKKNTENKNPEEESDSVVKDEQKLRKKVNVLMKKQKVKQVRAIVKEHDDVKPWGQDAQVKVCSLYS